MHWVLLDLGMPVELSLWCLESGLPKKARGGRAAEAYRVSPSALKRLCEREHPARMVSRWRPVVAADGVRCGERRSSGA